MVSVLSSEPTYSDLQDSFSPMDATVVGRLRRGMDEEEVATLWDVFEICGERGAGPAEGHGNRNYDPRRGIYGSVRLSETAMRVAADMLDQKSLPAIGEFVGSLCEAAYRDTKEQEMRRLVPFGVRQAEFIRGNYLEPSNFQATYTSTYIIAPDDGPKNDDE